MMIRKHIPVLIIILIVFFVFWRFFLRGDIYISADMHGQFYPWSSIEAYRQPVRNMVYVEPIFTFFSYMKYYNEQLHQGHLGLWNPYVFSGFPQHAALQWVFYPPMLVMHRLFDTLTALSLLMILHLLGSGLFMYLFLRSLGVSPWGAGGGGIAWMLGGTNAFLLEYGNVVASSMILPLTLWLAQRAEATQDRRYFVGIGFSLSLILLSEQLQQALYILIATACFFAVMLIKRLNQRLSSAEGIIRLVTWMTIAVVIAFGIASVNFLPFIELVQSSLRVEGRSSLSIKALIFGLMTIPRFIIPGLFASPADHPINDARWLPEISLSQLDFSGYMGVLTFFLALVALKFSRYRMRWVWGGFALLFLMSAIQTPLLYLFYLLPGIRNFIPGRMVYLYTFCIAVLAAMGFDAIRMLYTQNRAESLWKWLTKAYGILLVSCAMISLFWVIGRTSLLAFVARLGFANRDRAFGHSMAHYQHRAEQMIDILSNVYSFSNPALLGFFLVGMIALVLGWVHSRHRGRVGVLIAILMSGMTFDSLFHVFKYNPVASRNAIYPVTDVIRFLHRDTTRYRVAMIRAKTEDGDSKFFPGTLSPYHIQTLGGVASIYPVRYSRLMQALDQPTYSGPKGWSRFVILDAYNAPLLDFMNVKYFLTGHHKNLPESKFDLVYENEVRVYQNSAVRPRASIVHDFKVIPDDEELLKRVAGPDFNPQKTVYLGSPPSVVFKGSSETTDTSNVQIVSYESNRVELEVYTSRPGFLVLADVFYPGWHAVMDDVETEIVRANYCFRAVYVPTGAHHVVFSYAPMSFKIGLLISLISVGSGGVVVLFMTFKRGHNR